MEDGLGKLEEQLPDQAEFIDKTVFWWLVTLSGIVSLGAFVLLYLWSQFSRFVPSSSITQHDLSATDEVQTGDPAPRTGLPDGSTATSGPRAPIPGHTSRGVQRIRFRSGVINDLVEGINKSRRVRGDVEVGFALVGKVRGQGHSRIIEVTGLIEEGPNAARSGGHHKADRSYQQRQLEILQIAEPEVMYVGDAHLHPGDLDTCSGGDYRTDLANVQESHTQEMVFVIATRILAHYGVQSPSSLYHGGLKLDFFALGKSTGYQYLPFKPEIVEGRSLEVTSQFRHFIEADPIRTRLDVDNLRRLAAYQMELTTLSLDGQQSRPSIVMRHKTRGFKTIIALGDTPQARPEVYVDTGSQLVQFQPPYLNGGWTSVVWFTPIILDVEREMSGRLGAGAHNETKPLAGGRSAPAEAKRSGPIGEDHGKL